MHNQSATAGSPYLGIQFMLLSALGFTLMAVCVKLVSHSGIPLFEIIAVRALISVILSYLMVKKKRISIWGHNKLLLSCRGVIGTTGLICVYYALTVLPLAEATIIQNTTPIITSILAFLFLKERIHLSTILSIALGAFGVVIIVKPDLFFASQVDDIPTFGLIVALMGATASSVAYTIVKKLSRKEDPAVIVFYFPLFALPVALFLLGNEIVVPDLYQLVLLILVGLFTQIGQVFITKAMKVGAASKTMAYSYIQVLFAIALGIFFFNEVPTSTTLMGTVLIIGGALINLFKENKS
ncbi:DMT family transporter [Vibrio sp. SS-MA-C1-2]|uniref:DMT family transporter n=1 Tax=Vibrio sp. SS-MA-C1-2 TaxID=2908646 RepID=UPI001F193681|nr:DMT family transporter [Vibrio sp. SS-MA-C1-2]UJF16973.1 DMT family transporter [Vibrio sp. SS-MA-C1-2]